MMSPTPSKGGARGVADGWADYSHTDIPLRMMTPRSGAAVQLKCKADVPRKCRRASESRLPREAAARHALLRAGETHLRTGRTRRNNLTRRSVRCELARGLEARRPTDGMRYPAGEGSRTIRRASCMVRRAVHKRRRAADRVNGADVRHARLNRHARASLRLAGDKVRAVAGGAGNALPTAANRLRRRPYGRRWETACGSAALLLTSEGRLLRAQETMGARKRSPAANIGASAGRSLTASNPRLAILRRDTAASVCVRIKTGGHLSRPAGYCAGQRGAGADTAGCAGAHTTGRAGGGTSGCAGDGASSRARDGTGSATGVLHTGRNMRDASKGTAHLRQRGHWGCAAATAAACAPA